MHGNIFLSIKRSALIELNETLQILIAHQAVIPIVRCCANEMHGAASGVTSVSISNVNTSLDIQHLVFMDRGLIDGVTTGVTLIGVDRM